MFITIVLISSCFSILYMLLTCYVFYYCINFIMLFHLLYSADMLCLLLLYQSKVQHAHLLVLRKISTLLSQIKDQSQDVTPRLEVSVVLQCFISHSSIFLPATIIRRVGVLRPSWLTESLLNIIIRRVGVLRPSWLTESLLNIIIRRVGVLRPSWLTESLLNIIIRRVGVLRPSWLTESLLNRSRW